jgi:hypothetical protein
MCSYTVVCVCMIRTSNMRLLIMVCQNSSQGIDKFRRKSYYMFVLNWMPDDHHWVDLLSGAKDCRTDLGSLFLRVKIDTRGGIV